MVLRAFGTRRRPPSCRICTLHPKTERHLNAVLQSKICTRTRSRRAPRIGTPNPTLSGGSDVARPARTFALTNDRQSKIRSRRASVQTIWNAAFTGATSLRSITRLQRKTSFVSRVTARRLAKIALGIGLVVASVGRRFERCWRRPASKPSSTPASRRSVRPSKDRAGARWEDCDCGPSVSVATQLFSRAEARRGAPIGIGLPDGEFGRRLRSSQFAFFPAGACTIPSMGARIVSTRALTMASTLVVASIARSASNRKHDESIPSAILARRRAVTRETSSFSLEARYRPQARRRR